MATGFWIPRHDLRITASCRIGKRVSRSIGPFILSQLLVAFILTWVAAFSDFPVNFRKTEQISESFQEISLFRIWLTLITALVLSAASLPAQYQIAANHGTASGMMANGYIPVVVNDPVAGDPYALVAVRRQLPWLGGTIGSNQQTVLAGPTNNTGLLGGPGLWGGPGLFSGPGLFGGPGLNRGGQTVFGQPAWIGNGQLFPRVHSTFDRRLYFNADWLLWDTKGMDTPELVTSSTAGTARDIAAVRGEPGSSTLFGGNELNGDTVSGLRVGGGMWITPQQNFAIEAEYFRLAEQDDRFTGNSDGSFIIGRPFFDIVAGQETAQLISYPNLVRGDINVDTSTKFRSFLINGRASLCPQGCNQCGYQDHIDWIIGYRRMKLDDTIQIDESLTSLLQNAPGTIAVTDRFDTENEFNGLQLGVVHRANFQRAWLESMLRVALGQNQQTVRINGTNTITEAGLTDTLQGGLLAQRTNIGQHSRDQFTMIPEVGVKLGIRVTKALSASVGYSVIYFPNVVRAGDQIDTDLNPNLVPPEVVPFSGALRPRFTFNESDYWAHGLSVGGELAF